MGPLYKEHISVQKSSHSLSSFPHLPFYYIEHTCKIFLRVVWISTFWLDNPLAWLVNSHIMSSNNSTVCEYEAGYKQEKQKSLEKELSKEKSQMIWLSIRISHGILSSLPAPNKYIHIDKYISKHTYIHIYM